MTNHFLAATPQETKETLAEINRKMQEEETQAKAKSFGMPYINLHRFPIDLNVLGLITEEEAKAMGAVPFYMDSKDLRFAVVDPYSLSLEEKAEEFSKKHKLTVYLTSPSSLKEVLKLYSKVLRPKPRTEEVLKIEKQENYNELFESLKIPEQQHQKTATQLLQYMFGGGIFYKASDIHLEPEAEFVKLRFRVDGVLHDILHIDKHIQKQLLMKIKILSHLKLNTENVPQDGRLTFYYLNQAIDVRVSILPSAYGEEFVMRLLGTTATSLKLKDLGFRREVLEKVQEVLQKPQGMVITTGPTGSGKTTSLYAFLNELNEPGVKIITLEDPVEYKMEGVVQTPIDHNVNFDFASGLRAILRQDPDIVMVGEIRDQETADTACQAALTGHMVLSTLHTNDAAGAVPRLLNMGVKPFVLAPAVSCVLAQRLVRKICQDCKVPAKLAPHVLEKVMFALKNISKNSGINLPKEIQFFHATGCEKCNKIGYKGRVGVYEVFKIDEAVQGLILNDTSSMSEYKKAAYTQGMLTMLQDGLLKALDGITDVEEVYRVVGEA